jgi:hypothetical protein
MYCGLVADNPDDRVFVIEGAGDRLLGDESEDLGPNLPLQRVLINDVTPSLAHEVEPPSGAHRQVKQDLHEGIGGHIKTVICHCVGYRVVFESTQLTTRE